MAILDRFCSWWILTLGEGNITHHTQSLGVGCASQLPPTEDRVGRARKTVIMEWRNLTDTTSAR